MPENKKFWKFCNQAGNKVELLLYGDISQTSWWGDEVTPKQFAEELAGLGALDEITVRINSGGGDVFAAQAIGNQLEQHPAAVTAKIDGLCASAATIVACHCGKVIAATDSTYMVHPVRMGAYGYQSNLREKGPDLKIGKDHELANYIETTITERECSPAAVLGYAMLEGRTFETSVSVTTIYSYIKKGLFLHITQVDLPRRGKVKQKYKKVKTKKDQARASVGESIEQRPPEVESREEFGHWEGDTVYSGKGKCKTTSALLTLNERKTRKDIIIGIPNRKAETVVKALDALERKCGARRFRAIFKSITFDNGSEFSAAEVLERSAVNKTIPRTKVYYCHPYSSWERGSNENANSMIRRRHPKGTDFSKVSAAEIAATEEWINNYPRKILGYKSSEVMFRECLREIGLIA